MKKLFIILFSVFLTFSATTAVAATLTVSPASGTYEVGDRVVVKVLVSSQHPINAISGVLNIPTSLFTIESVSKAGSVLNFWVTEPSFSNGAGVLSFEGVSLEGFPGGTKTVITATLKATSTGTGSLTFKSGQILANDGAGSDVTDSLNGATFSVKEATVKPPKPTLTPEPAPVPEVVEQPVPTLKAPEILLSEKYGTQSIMGTSNYPKSQVLLTFVAEDGAKVFILGMADADGSFNVLVPNSLKAGTYTVTAVMIQEDKTNSDISNAIVIVVGNIFSDVGWQIWLVFGLLVVSILYLLIRVYSHFGKNKDVNISNSKNKLREAEEIVHKSFDILREDVIEYGNERLPNAERKHISEIKKDIIEAEKIIDKKIKDME